MLHKLEIPAYRPQLEAILDFQQHLLAYACTAPALPLNPTALKTEFGEQRGGWLSNRCWQGRREHKFYKSLAKLINYIARNPSEGQVIVTAFKNDREFYKHLDDVDFEFQYTRLSPLAKEAVKPLMIAFYERLLVTGFPDYFHTCKNEIFTRKLLLKGFYDANPRLKVCPGCDGTPPYISSKTLDIEIEAVDEDDYQDEAEVDHFFPKASYPFFSIHFMNLVPLCETCNTKAKKDKDPLGQSTGKGALQRIFIPFSNPAAQCIEVIISKSANSSHRVSIKNRAGLASLEQVENLNRPFNLHPGGSII